MEVFQSNKEKKLSFIVFGVYLLLLCWLVLFKFATSIDEIPHLRSVNLIPFHYSLKTSFQFKEVLYNILVFIPAGYYFTALFAKRNLLSGVGLTALMSLFFETTQWIFAIGASDITDLITNTLGGLCGMALFFLMGKIAGSHRMKIINIIGIVIEVAGCALLALLLIAN